MSLSRHDPQPTCILLAQLHGYASVLNNWDWFLLHIICASWLMGQGYSYTAPHPTSIISHLISSLSNQTISPFNQTSLPSPTKSQLTASLSSINLISPFSQIPHLLIITHYLHFHCIIISMKPQNEFRVKMNEYMLWFTLNVLPNRNDYKSLHLISEYHQIHRFHLFISSLC